MRIDRLEKLSAHLHSGKLGLDYFDFSKVFKRRIMCGTSGCMAGELPYAFPEDWRLDSRACMVLLRDSYGNDVEHGLCPSLKRFFELSEEEMSHLFFPEDQDTELYGGEDLHGQASLSDVLFNLDVFIKKAKAGEI